MPKVAAKRESCAGDESKALKARVRRRGAPAEVSHANTMEADAYLMGLYTAFAEQAKQYELRTNELLQLEARVDIAEKNLRVTRDHLAMSVQRAEGIVPPRAWSAALAKVRFVGMRLADACVELLREKQRMTPRELLEGLNSGMFRFRTSAPLREIHGALLRHPNVRRSDDQQHWLWMGDGDQLALKLVRPPATDQKEEAQTK